MFIEKESSYIEIPVKNISEMEEIILIIDHIYDTINKKK